MLKKESTYLKARERNGWQMMMMMSGGGEVTAGETGTNASFP